MWNASFGDCGALKALKALGPGLRRDDGFSPPTGVAWLRLEP
jgi:hypothetical protein